MLMPPGHPIILLKSNLFNMADVSVKWSIACFLASSRDKGMFSSIDKGMLHSADTLQR